MSQDTRTSSPMKHYTQNLSVHIYMIAFIIDGILQARSKITVVFW